MNKVEGLPIEILFQIIELTVSAEKANRLFKVITMLGVSKKFRSVVLSLESQWKDINLYKGKMPDQLFKTIIVQNPCASSIQNLTFDRTQNLTDEKIYAILKACASLSSLVMLSLPDYDGSALLTMLESSDTKLQLRSLNATGNGSHYDEVFMSAFNALIQSRSATFVEVRPRQCSKECNEVIDDTNEKNCNDCQTFIELSCDDCMTFSVECPGECGMVSCLDCAEEGCGFCSEWSCSLKECIVCESVICLSCMVDAGLGACCHSCDRVICPDCILGTCSCLECAKYQGSACSGCQQFCCADCDEVRFGCEGN